MSKKDKKKHKASSVLPPEAETLLREYNEAMVNTRSWKNIAEVKRAILDQLLTDAGYSMDKEDLAATRVLGLAGNTPFEIRPTSGSRLDQKLLKEKYPEVYQACQKKSTSYQVVLPGLKEDEG